MANPIPGKSVSTPYGKRGSHWSCEKNSQGQGIHTGIDIAAPNGTKIYAPIAGQIRHRSYGSAFGKHQFAISPDDDQPFGKGEVFFAHCRTRLADGTRVEIGDFVAEVGAEGNVTGPHLHMEYMPNTKNAWRCGIHANPQPILEHSSGGTTAAAAVTANIYSNKLGYGEPTNGDDFSDTIKELQHRLNNISLPAPGNVTLPLTGKYDDATDTVVRTWQEFIGNTPDAPKKSYLGPAQRAKMFSSPPYTIHDKGLPAIASGTPTPEPEPAQTSVLGQWLKAQGFVVHDDAPLGRESTWRGVEFLMVHHTGSPEGTKPENDARWIRSGNADAPLAQLMLDEQGEVWVCCRERDGQPDPGRASHAGSGKGFGVPDDKMNEVSLGIEVCNDGKKPLASNPSQYAVLVRLLRVLSERYKVPVEKIIGHKDWSDTGKVDPLDDMDQIRADVTGAVVEPPTPEPVAAGQVKVITAGGDEVLIAKAIEVLALVGDTWVTLELPTEGEGETTPPPQLNYHATVQVGEDIQMAMDKARDWYMANRSGSVDFSDATTMATVELAPGVHERTESLRYRRGVRLVLTGATILKTAGTSNLFVNDDNGGGGYSSPNFDWCIVGGTLDGGGLGGCISTAHVRRFRLDGVTLTNIGAKKHHLEINSSGGPAQPGAHTCEVLNCEFFQAKKATNARAEDEAIQLDYSWPGAAPGTADDGTVTNNVLIEGCEFHDIPRAIGSHHWQRESGNASPKGYHSNITIRGNKFWDVDPTVSGWGDGANGSNSEGAIRAYAWSGVTIENNELTRCYQPINLYIPSDAVLDHGNPSGFVIRGNRIKDKTSSRAGILGDSAKPELRFESVLVEANTFDGTWGGTTYAVAVNESGGAVPGHAEGVVITNNRFQPSNMTLAEEKAYNKYRAKSSANATGVKISGNTVSDGTTDNS